MADISATVVTLNEEDHIRNCLETLTWCDEIIIVDSYSDDATVEIASEYTDQIYTYERTGYGDPARKKALEEASGDWICMVDADERIPKHLANKLRDIIDQDEYDVINVPRKNYILGRWIDAAGWWPDYRPVLHKPEVTELTDEIHKFISFTENARVKNLNKIEENAIIHFNYTDISDFINRMDRYTDIEAKQTDFRYHRLITSPLIEFGLRYFLKEGFKKGMVGLLLSIFMSWYRFLIITKAWQYKTIGDEDEIQRGYSDIDENLKES